MARVASPSPPIDPHAAMASPPPVNKRDKKRQMLQDKLADVTAAFSGNRDRHYRGQLQALQVDMTMVLAADPYANAPLDDSGLDIDALIADATGVSDPPDDVLSADYKAMVGKHYRRFVDEVNDLLEERDSDLASVWNRYRSDCDELTRQNQYRVRIAEEEHRQLAKTIRERLIQATSTKRTKLLREKEQLDISDSNAMLLHPNQFTFAHPASPGGAHGNRKTRHTRHRALDPDDLAGAVDAQERKRKRRAAFPDDDADEGAARGTTRADLGVHSPFHVAKARVLHTQFEAPLYSIDRLFTDKELAMATNMAALASTHFLAKLKAGPTTDTGGPADDPTDAAALALDDARPTHTPPDADPDDDPALAPPEMERTASQPHHATRGATRNGLATTTDPFSALALAAENLSAAATHSATGGLPLATAPVAPVVLPMPLAAAGATSRATAGAGANAAAPPPPPVPPADVERDWSLMTRAVPPGGDALNERLLASATASAAAREFEFRAPPAATAATQATITERGPGGVPMSAQNSTGGVSDLGGYGYGFNYGFGFGYGGVAMTRTGDGSSMGAGGGVGMRRTASGAGAGHLDGGMTTGRRGRGRGG